MEELLSLFLPEGLLSHFDIEHVEELGDISEKRMVYQVYLTEKTSYQQIIIERITSQSGATYQKQKALLQCNRAFCLILLIIVYFNIILEIDVLSFDCTEM